MGCNPSTPLNLGSQLFFYSYATCDWCGVWVSECTSGVFVHECRVSEWVMSGRCSSGTSGYGRGSWVSHQEHSSRRFPSPSCDQSSSGVYSSSRGCEYLTIVPRACPVLPGWCLSPRPASCFAPRVAVCCWKRGSARWRGGSWSMTRTQQNKSKEKKDNNEKNNKIKTKQLTSRNSEQRTLTQRSRARTTRLHTHTQYNTTTTHHTRK